MYRRLLELLKLVKPRQPHLPQTNVSGSFKEWYLEFRSEMAKSFGVNYSISIASWTFSENHKHYYDKGFTPKEAVLKYAKMLNGICTMKNVRS
jgi:hypothetical protein